MTKLSDEFGKERNLLVLCCAFLISVSLFNLSAEEKIPFLGFKLPSSDLVLPVSVALIVYFSFRLILEWAKSSETSKEMLASKFDFYTTLLISFCSLGLAIYKFTEGNVIWSYPPITTLSILVVGEFVAATTCLNIENLKFIRRKDEALKKGLPRVPVAVRATLIFIPVNVLLLSITSTVIYFFVSDPLKGNWYWIIFIPFIFHLLLAIYSFIFPNEKLIAGMEKAFEQHDAAYQVGGWDRLSDSNDSDLYKAAEAGDYSTVEELLLNGCDPDEKNRLGWSPFLICVANGDERLVKLFIEHGADVNSKNTLGRSGLHFACNYGYIHIAILLLEAGAKVNIEDSGHSGIPLHVAVKSGCIELVRKLLEYDAEVSVRDYTGKTALDYAQESGHGEIAKLLRNQRRNANKSSNTDTASSAGS